MTDLTPESAAVRSNHDRIFLSPACDDNSDEGRTWCPEDMGKCDDCNDPSVEYIRADIVASRIAAAVRDARVEMYDMAKAQEAAELIMRDNERKTKNYTMEMMHGDRANSLREFYTRIRALIASTEGE